MGVSTGNAAESAMIDSSVAANVLGVDATALRADHVRDKLETIADWAKSKGDIEGVLRHAVLKLGATGGDALNAMYKAVRLDQITRGAMAKTEKAAAEKRKLFGESPRKII